MSTTNAKVITVVVVMLTFHAVIVLRHLPLSSFLNGDPLLSNDLSFHFAHMGEAREAALSNSGRIYGYSDNFMAGYPAGLWNSVGRKIYELAGGVLASSGLSLAQSFYICIVLMALLTPVLLLLSGIVAGLRGWPVCWMLGVALATYHFENTTSYFWTFGNFAFPLASSMAVLCVALLCELCRKYSLVRTLVLGAILACTFWVHPLAGVPVIAGGLIALIVFRESLKELSIWVGLTTAALVALSIASAWLFPLIQSLELRAPINVLALPSGVKHLLSDVVSDRAYGNPYDRREVFHALMVLGIAGGLSSLGRNRTILVMALSSVVMIGVTHLFGHIDFFKQAQPYRFVVPAMFFATVPAAIYAERLFHLFRETDRAGRTIAVVLACILLPNFTAVLLDLRYRAPASSLTDSDRQIVDYFSSISPQGRVACDGGPICNALPFLTDVNVIGGAISEHGVIIHNWSAITVRHAFGRKPLDEISDGRLLEYLDLYQVAYLVSSGTRIANLCRTNPDFCSEVLTVGPRSVYEIKLPQPSPIWGQIKYSDITLADGNLTIANAPRGSFGVPMHYWKGLQGTADVELSPEYLLDDPVPFLHIGNASGVGTVSIKW